MSQSFIERCVQTYDSGLLRCAALGECTTRGIDMEGLVVDEVFKKDAAGRLQAMAKAAVTQGASLKSEYLVHLATTRKRGLAFFMANLMELTIHEKVTVYLAGGQGATAPGWLHPA